MNGFEVVHESMLTGEVEANLNTCSQEDVAVMVLIFRGFV